MKERFDKYFGQPLSKWIACLPNELEKDIVFLEGIIPVGRDSFGLNGDELYDFVQECLLVLLRRGGKLVADDSADKNWSKIADHQGEDEEIAALIIEYWKTLKVEPDWYSLWFSLPDK